MEGKFTTMAKAVVPHSKWDGHWDGYAADDLCKAKRGNHAGNGLQWLAEKSWKIRSWVMDLEELPHLSIPLLAG